MTLQPFLSACCTIGSRKANELTTVIPKRIGRDDHPFISDIFAVTGMNIAAANSDPDVTTFVWARHTFAYIS
ncbi:MAG TPA: hypothetical protein VFR94_22990 [Nitrososphaeraceae archaeon]|nr:hypothetical protein [Nitrososphaeraceae archaeon]